MKQNQNDNDIDRILIENIGKLPYKDPPEGMAETILRSLAPKKMKWWRRFYIWVKTPKTFSVSPFALAPALVVVMVFLTFTASFYFKENIPESFKQIGEYQRNVPVSLIFKHQKAASVAVIGTFNHWNPKGYEMEYNDALGAWMLKFKLPTGRHDYVFLVDSRTSLPDPLSEFTRDDGFGNLNSVLFVKNNYGQKI